MEEARCRVYVCPIKQQQGASCLAQTHYLQPIHRNTTDSLTSRRAVWPKPTPGCLLTVSNFFSSLCRWRLMIIISTEYWTRSGWCLRIGSVPSGCMLPRAGRWYHVTTGGAAGISWALANVTWRSWWWWGWWWWWSGYPSCPSCLPGWRCATAAGAGGAGSLVTLVLRTPVC